MSSSASVSDFPLEDTLGGGEYHPDEHYLGGGADQLYFGHSPARPGERYLITMAPDSGLALERLRPKLMQVVPGFFEPMFVGHFDAVRDDAELDSYRTTRCGLVERLPEGGPLKRVVPDARPWATSLGRQVGALLSAAVAAGGENLTGLRPEFVWVRMEGENPIVSGLGGRSGMFLASAARRRDLPTAPLFTQKYFAPEVYRGEPHDDRALVLTLAVMIAEWATGEYPYAMDGRWGYSNLCAGRHRELALERRLADLLVSGLRPDATERPDLATFVEALERLQPDGSGP